MKKENSTRTADHFTRAGQIVKSNGTDGQVVINLSGNVENDFDLEKEPVFIFFDELPVPFFITVDSERGNGRILARLTDINSREDADEIAGRCFYIPSASCDGDGIADLTGWTVIDGNAEAPDRRTAGKVTAVEDIPGNPCLEIETPSGQRVLIPFHEDLVESIDENNEVLMIYIPKGILE